MQPPSNNSQYPNLLICNHSLNKIFSIENPNIKYGIDSTTIKLLKSKFFYFRVFNQF